MGASWPTQGASATRQVVLTLCAATLQERRTAAGRGPARETHLGGGWLLVQAIQLITAAAFQQAVTILALHVGACSMDRMDCYLNAAAIAAPVQQAVASP